jgi:hypothetical protein
MLVGRNLLKYGIDPEEILSFYSPDNFYMFRKKETLLDGRFLVKSYAVITVPSVPEIVKNLFSATCILCFVKSLMWSNLKYCNSGLRISQLFSIKYQTIMRNGSCHKPSKKYTRPIPWGLDPKALWIYYSFYTFIGILLYLYSYWYVILPIF